MPLPSSLNVFIEKLKKIWDANTRLFRQRLNKTISFYHKVPYIILYNHSITYPSQVLYLLQRGMPIKVVCLKVHRELTNEELSRVII